MKPRRRIIAVDPGTVVSGVAVADYDSDSGKNLVLLDCAAITVEGSRPFRLNWLLEKLQAFFKKWGTERVDVCVERAWVGKNPQTAIIIGEARGVILAAAGGIRRARFFDYMTPHVRKSLGLGRDGDKYQTAIIVKAILKIPEDVELPLDATDAAAILVHHYLQGNKLHPYERD
jgi:crossover junction endodeoxyribonuclease RuvC